MREAPQRTFYAQYHFSLSQINLYMYSCFKRLRKDIKSLDDEIQVISFFVFNFSGHVHPTIFLCIYLVLVAVCGLSLVTRAGGCSLVGLALASYCGGFFCCGAQVQGAWASVVAACRLSSCDLLALGYLGFPSYGAGLISCGSWALECRLGSCDAWTSCSEACETSLDQ